MEWWRYIYEPLVFLMVGYVALRMMGKRSVAETALFDFLLVLVVANVISAPLQENATRFLPAVIMVAMVVLVHQLLSFFKTNQYTRQYVRNEPQVLIRHGNIEEKALKKAQLTIQELLGELRVKGYTRPQDVEFAILEEMGKLSVVPKSEKKPLTPQDVGVTTGYEGIPVPLVIDGQLQFSNMAKIQLSREQVMQMLNMQGINESSLRFVALAVLDERGNLLVDWNDDLNQGQVHAEEQGILVQIKQELRKQPPPPEETDWGLVDDYIKPPS